MCILAVVDNVFHSSSHFCCLCTHMGDFQNSFLVGACVAVVLFTVFPTLRCALKGSVFSKRHSLGHLLLVDAVLSIVHRVLKGNVFPIDTPWGISSLWTLRCGTYAVFSRDVFFQINTPWGISSGRTLCCVTYAAFSMGCIF
jgi:hypothetical protein